MTKHLGAGDSKNASASPNLTANNIGSMASQLMGILNEQLEWLKNSESADAFSETRTKMALALSKGVQTLEDLLNRMELASNAASCPPEALEVRNKLAKQISIIAKRGVEGRGT